MQAHRHTWTFKDSFAAERSGGGRRPRSRGSRACLRHHETSRLLVSTSRMIYHAFRARQARHVAVRHRRSMRTDFQRHVVVVMVTP